MIGSYLQPKRNRLSSALSSESPQIQESGRPPEVASATEPYSKGASDCLQIRDRIRELRRVPAKDLLPNPKNWRRHPKAQAAALRGLLDEIGYSDALLVRELPDGKLMLIDGHLRAETTPDAQVPVLVLDLDEKESDKLLLTLDPLASMAESDAERITALLQPVPDQQRSRRKPAETYRRGAGVADYPS